jgi:hypothetical protein
MLRSHRIPCSCVPAPLFHISPPCYTLRTSIAPPLQCCFKVCSCAHSLFPVRLLAAFPPLLTDPLSRLADFTHMLSASCFLLHLALPLRLTSLRFASLGFAVLAKLSQAPNVIKTGYRTSRVWMWSSENGRQGGVDQPSQEWY